MAVMARETWTDERLDDLKEGMNGRFDRLEAETKEGFTRVDEMKEGFLQAKTTSDERFTRVDREIEQVVASIKELRGDMKELHGDIKGMQRLMMQGFIGICTLMVTCFGILTGITAF